MTVPVGFETLQPHLWDGERVVWGGRPGRLGTLLANLRHSVRRANDTVDVFSLPLQIFALVVLFSSALAVLLVPYLLAVLIGVLVVALALGAALVSGLVPWLRPRASRAICYAVTTRRVLALRGAEAEWDAHHHWVRARVAWTAGGIGTVVFARDRNARLEVRFTGVEDPRLVADIASRAAAQAGKP